MKKIMLIFLMGVISLLLLVACSEDDDNENNDPEIIYGYALEQFVPSVALDGLIIHDDDDDEEWRNLFYFWCRATDGYSPRNKNYDDLDWQNWVQGFYIPEWDNRVYFPQYAAQDIGAYHTKYMETVYVSRGIRSIINDTLSVVFELNAMPTQQVENYDGVMEPAIALADFIPVHFTTVDSVLFTDVSGGYAKTYYPDELADGFWLVDTQKTIFPNFPDMSNSKKKFKWLMTIDIFGTWLPQEEFFNEALADTLSADWSFSFPEDLSTFESIVWE